MMDETFLTTEEVLEYLQVNLRTVYRLIKAGKIPAVRVGRQWRFRKRDIDGWLDSQRPRGAARPAATAPSPPQGPVPTPVRLLTCSKVLAPARMALSTVPLRILLHRQAGLRFSMTACSLAFCSTSSMGSSSETNQI